MGASPGVIRLTTARQTIDCLGEYPLIRVQQTFLLCNIGGLGLLPRPISGLPQCTMEALPCNYVSALLCRYFMQNRPRLAIALIADKAC